MTSIEFIRQFKIGEYAIFDFVVSFLFALLISPILTKLFRIINLEIPRASWLYLTIPISILVHIIVGNITPMTRDFISLKGGVFIKILIVALVILGIRLITIIRK